MVPIIDSRPLTLAVRAALLPSDLCKRGSISGGEQARKGTGTHWWNTREAARPKGMKATRTSTLIMMKRML